MTVATTPGSVDSPAALPGMTPAGLAEGEAAGPAGAAEYGLLCADSRVHLTDDLAQARELLVHADGWGCGPHRVVQWRWTTLITH